MKTKIKCLVIDDEPIAIEILTKYIGRISFLDLTGVFRDSVEALEFMQAHRVDLVFLDINMPDLNGIQFLNALDHRPMVIFTTAHAEYALESYEYEAIDYLLKPIEFERFLKAVNRALSKFQSFPESESKILEESPSKAEKSSKTIFIKDGKTIHRVNVKDILYVEGTKNYVTVITTKKEIMTLITMKEMLSRLPENTFFRIHKSYIINFHHVEEIEREQVKIKGKLIPIGNVYREDFFKAINQGQTK